jgi:peptidoglycan hydrolase-like protein with peptidoglycan-binding domain
VLVAAVPAFAGTLYRQLDLGKSGADVSSLQTYLATDPAMYPSGLVTGYFGQLTKAGVERFQTQAGIVSQGTPATTGYGRVGPATLIALNARMDGGVVGGSDIAPSIMNVSVSTARNNTSIYWGTNESSKGVVYYSTTPLVTYERQVSVDVSGMIAMTDANFRTTQNVSLTNLASNTTYYYLIYVTDVDGNVSVTAPGLSFTTTN